MLVKLSPKTKEKAFFEPLLTQIALRKVRREYKKGEAFDLNETLAV